MRTMQVITQIDTSSDYHTVRGDYYVLYRYNDLLVITQADI